MSLRVRGFRHLGKNGGDRAGPVELDRGYQRMGPTGATAAGEHGGESLVAVLLDALGVDLLLASAPGGGGAGRGERRDCASAPEGKICDKS